MRWTESGSTDFEQAPIGAQVARCIRMIDIGTQTGEWQGKPTHKRQIVLSWELPNCLMTEGESAGKPFIVSKFYTASLSEKATLRHDLVSWRGREFTPEELAGFDAKNIIGKTCMLGLTDKNGKTRVTTVMQLPKGMPVPESINQYLYFSLDEFDQAMFDVLSKGIKAMIEKSPEYESISNRPHDSGTLQEMDDDIPWDEKDDISF